MISTRPTIIEIDLRNIGYNVKQFKSIISNAELMAVVKADGYGHGGTQVAIEAIKNGATWLGVATAEEGIQLRESGIQAPILVLGGISPEEIIDCHYNNIDVSVYSKNFVKQIDKYAGIFKEPLNVHLKVDTGMHRLGVLPTDLPSFLKEVKNKKYIKVRGIFTHFPSAIGDKKFSKKQIEDFIKSIDLAEEILGEISYKHAANSAAVINLPESHFNLVRVGLGLYGYHDEIQLYRTLDIKPALRWKTKITSLREVPTDSCIGYGRTYNVKKNSKIATIPVGYADGYKRSLSNKGMALVKGQRVNIAGRICMDQTMIDVTDVPNVTEGDEVVLIGRQGNEEISIYEICQWANTIPNDILVSIGERVDRVYITAE